MKTQLKDVLHFYLGCKCIVKLYDTEYRGIFLGLNYPFLYIQVASDKAPTKHRIDKIDFKPILRPLSDMTDIEKDEFSEHQIDNFGEDFHNEMYDISQFLFLLKQGFDIFGLISSGQAIDKTKY